MGARESQFIIDTLNLIHERSGNDFKWEQYTKDIKTVLDSRFGRKWNVLIGKSMGYAMKTKKKSSLIASSSTKETVICWKSPGFEVEDVEVVRIKAELVVGEKDSLLESAGDHNKKLNVIQSPLPDSDWYTAQTPKGIRLPFLLYHHHIPSIRDTWS